MCIRCVNNMLEKIFRKFTNMMNFFSPSEIYYFGTIENIDSTKTRCKKQREKLRLKCFKLII